MGFIPSDDDKFDLDEARDRIAQKYGVPKAVWKKMVGQESGGDESAVSAKKATSAWQIMPATAKGLGIDPSDPLQAAEGGLRLLRDNYKRFRPKAKNEKHAWMMAVAGYHGNPENVEKDLKKGGYGLPNISDGAITTRDHVLKIFDGLDGVYDRSPLGSVEGSASNAANGTNYDPNAEEPRPAEVKIGGKSAEKYASEEEIAQYEAKFGKVAPGIIPDSARKPQIPTTSPTIPVPSRLNPQAAPGQAEQNDPSQPRKLSLKTATGSELVESDDPTPVPAGKRRLVDKANGKTYLAAEGTRTKTEQGEQINYNIEREIPDYLAGKSKPNAVLMPNDPAAVQAYKVLRDHTGLPDTAELRRRFIAGYEAVKRGERTEIFSRSEQAVFDDIAALRAEQAEKQASAPKQRGKAVQPQNPATQTAFSEAPTTASELPRYQFEKTGKLTLNNGTELALVKDTEDKSAPAGFARFQDADGETYLFDKASGKLKDESLAGVADTLPLTLVPYNQRNSVRPEQAKQQQAFQVASQLATKYPQIDSADAYQWLLARGFTDLATGQELPQDRYYQSAESNRGARNRSIEQGASVGAPGTKTPVDGTPDDYYQLSRRDLRDMTAYTLEARKNREDEAMRLVAQGVTLTPEFLRQNRIKPEDLEKRRDDYEMAKVQGKVSREQMERLMPQLIAQGNDPYRAAILARKRLGFARDASGKDTADAELAAYDRLKNEQIKENAVAFNQDRGIADLQKMQIAGSYGLDHKNFDAEWKNKIETDAYQHVARMMKRHGSALAVEAAKAFEADQEAARVERVKQMGWGEYVAAQPRQWWGNINKGLVGMLVSESLRGSVVYSKAAIDFLESATGSGELWGKSKVEDHPWYKASKAVDKWFEENFTTNKDLDKEILSGQVPHAIGTSIAFLFPSLAKNPKAAIGLMSTLQMGGGNFEEAIQAGASEEDAMRYSLMSSAALGWTEILGISNAFTRLIKGVGGTTAKQFMREFLKSAPKEVAEEVFLNEGPQTIGQNVLARLTYDPDRKWDKGLATAVAVATLSAGATSGFITGVNTIRNQRLIRAQLKFDAANGGPTVRNLGVSGLYVKGKPQPITDELKPLVDKHTDNHDRIVSNFEAIEKIRERAKGLELDQRLKLFRTVRRLQEENFELGQEQAKIAEKIVEASGVPDPDILEQAADYEDARAEARGEVVAVPETAADVQAQSQIPQLTPDVNLTGAPVAEPQIPGQSNAERDAYVPKSNDDAAIGDRVTLLGRGSGTVESVSDVNRGGRVQKQVTVRMDDGSTQQSYGAGFSFERPGHSDLATPQPEHIASPTTSEERFEAAKRRAEGPKTRASQIDEKTAAVEQAAPAQAKPLTALEKFNERKLGHLGYNEEQRAELTPEQRKQVLKDRIKRSDFFRKTPKIIKPVTLAKPTLVEFSVRGMYGKLKNSHNVARLRRAGWTFKNLNKQAVTVTGAPEGVLEANIAGGEFENAVYNIDTERMAQRKPSARAGKPFFQAKKGQAQTLTELVRSLGGIRPDAADTRSGKKRGNLYERLSGIPGIINRNADSNAEEMARRAVEYGYLREYAEDQHGEGSYEDEIMRGEHDRIRKDMLEELLNDLTPEEMKRVESIADFLSDEEVWPIFEDAEFYGEISPENRDKAVKRGLQYGVEKNVTDWFIQTLKEFTDRQRSARESAPQISEAEPQGPEPGGQSGEAAESPDDSIYADEFGDAYEPEDAETIGFDPSEFEDTPSESDLFDAALAELKAEAEPEAAAEPTPKDEFDAIDDIISSRLNSVELSAAQKETYNLLKTHFESAYAKGEGDAAAQTKAFLKKLNERFDLEKIEKLKPFIVAFLEEKKAKPRYKSYADVPDAEVERIAAAHRANMQRFMEKSEADEEIDSELGEKAVSEGTDAAYDLISRIDEKDREKSKALVNRILQTAKPYTEAAEPETPKKTTSEERFEQQKADKMPDPGTPEFADRLDKSVRERFPAGTRHQFDNGDIGIVSHNEGRKVFIQRQSPTTGKLGKPVAVDVESVAKLLDKPTSEQTTGTRTETSEPTVQKTDAAAPTTSEERFEEKKKKGKKAKISPDERYEAETRAREEKALAEGAKTQAAGEVVTENGTFKIGDRVIFRHAGTQEGVIKRLDGVGYGRAAAVVESDGKDIQVNYDNLNVFDPEYASDIAPSQFDPKELKVGDWFTKGRFDWEVDKIEDGRVYATRLNSPDIQEDWSYKALAAEEASDMYDTQFTPIEGWRQDEKLFARNGLWIGPRETFTFPSSKSDKIKAEFEIAELPNGKWVNSADYTDERDGYTGSGYAMFAGSQTQGRYDTRADAIENATKRMRERFANSPRFISWLDDIQGGLFAGQQIAEKLQLTPAGIVEQGGRKTAKPEPSAQTSLFDEKPETTSEERLEAEQQKAAEELKAKYPIGTELARGEGKLWTVTGYAEDFGGKGKLGVKLVRGSDSTIMGAKELAEKFTAAKAPAPSTTDTADISPLDTPEKQEQNRKDYLAAYNEEPIGSRGIIGDEPDIDENAVEANAKTSAERKAFLDKADKEAGAEKRANTPLSNTQVELSEKDASFVQSFRQREIDPSDIADRVDLPPYAKDGFLEIEPHITVKYGLHTNVAADVEPFFKGERPVTATLGKTSVFAGKDKKIPGTEKPVPYDVLIIEVDSPGLARLNKKVTDGAENTTTFEYKPHLTLAYLKPGMGEKYTGNNFFDGRKIRFDKVVFSPADKSGKVEIPLESAASNEVEKEAQLGLTSKDDLGEFADDFANFTPKGTKKPMATTRQSHGENLIKGGEVHPSLQKLLDGEEATATPEITVGDMIEFELFDMKLRGTILEEHSPSMWNVQTRERDRLIPKNKVLGKVDSLTEPEPEQFDTGLQTDLFGNPVAPPKLPKPPKGEKVESGSLFDMSGLDEEGLFAQGGPKPIVADEAADTGKADTAADLLQKQAEAEQRLNTEAFGDEPGAWITEIANRHTSPTATDVAKTLVGKRQAIIDRGGPAQDLVADIVPAMLEAAEAEVRGLTFDDYIRQSWLGKEDLAPKQREIYDRIAEGAFSQYFNDELNALEEVKNAPSGRTDLAEDSSGVGRIPDAVREEIPDAEPIADDSIAPEPSRQPETTETRPGSNYSLFGDGPIVSGEGSDLDLRPKASDDQGSPAGSAVDGRGGELFDPRASAEYKPSDAVREEAERSRSDVISKRTAQNAAEDIEAAHGDLDNIRRTLPFLHEHQQIDVHFAEKRFAKSDGVMFTNGTGTGKTFVGLGIVKRFHKQGKRNGIIVAPNDKILSDWQQSALNLNLHLKKLADTRDNGGTGTVLTTFANFRANKQLVERDWDFVIFDEAHYLGQNKDGNDTSALAMMRATTLHPRGAYSNHLVKNAEKIEEVAGLAMEVARIEKERRRTYGRDERRAVSARLEAAENKLRSAQRELDVLQKAAEDEFEAKLAAGKRSKVTFLSATPFAYEKNVEYAEGYLFDYGPEPGNVGGYGVPSAKDQFFITNFGYRMRYGKLTKPDADVNTELMEQEFNASLKKTGALSGRRIDIDRDYSRQFIVAESAIGNKIDEGFAFLWDKSRDDALSDEDRRAWRALAEGLDKRFNYLAKRFTLEAINARSAIPYIKQHLAMNRKVVVFHDYNKNEAIHPFDLSEDFKESKLLIFGDQMITKGHWDMLAAARPDLVNLDLSSLVRPQDLFEQEFGEGIGFFNGTVPKKKRREVADNFNADLGTVKILVAQSDAGKEGISLHDTTGKYQRVLINLGLPVKPTASIQTEGRIYRDGNMSDAIQLYMTTGTNFEQFAFGQTISQRASTAENLALGAEARALKQAFIDGYIEADPDYAPSEYEGKGGKEKDRHIGAPPSEYDRAKGFYFGQGKKTSRTKAQEGADYYATPEPVGFKMVEWADQRPMEHAIEPSAGHGAIARWFRPDNYRTVVEPSNTLAARLALATDARMVREPFEDLHHGANKADTVVMNPPFGVGGKTAIEHLAKAFKHLNNGGRVVALIPAGPAADKRLEQLLGSEAAKHIHQVADIKMPPVTFKRAGTQVSTHILVLEKQLFKPDADKVTTGDEYDFSDITDIKELFEAIENVEMPPRIDPTFDAKPQAAVPSITTDRNAVIEPTPRPIAEAQLDADSSLFDKAEFNHTKTGAPVFVAKLKAFDDVNFKYFRYTVAPRYGGYYSSYKGSGAVPGFHFKTPESREQFIQEAEQHVASKRLNSAIIGKKAIERAQYQPPYTTSVLQNEQFKNLAGRSVKVDTIKQVLKQQSVKAIERDIVNTVLEDAAFVGQTTISFDAFKEAVQLELMPLRVIESSSYSSYGLDNTGISDMRSTEDIVNHGDFSRNITHIYNTELEHGVTGHFGGDFNQQINPNRIGIGLEPTPPAYDWEIQEREQNGRPLFVVLRAGSNPRTEADLEANLGTVANTREQAEDWIKSLGSRSTPNKGMFGHTRVAYAGDKGIIVELQSDVYQKHKAEELIIQSYKNRLPGVGANELEGDESAALKKVAEMSDLDNEIAVDYGAYRRFKEGKNKLKDLNYEIERGETIVREMLAVKPAIDRYLKMAAKAKEAGESNSDVFARLSEKAKNDESLTTPLSPPTMANMSIHLESATQADAVRTALGGWWDLDTRLEEWKGFIADSEKRAVEAKAYLESDEYLEYEKMTDRLATLRKEFLAELPLRDKQFIAHRKNYTARLLREEVRNMAQKGLKEAWVVTPRTAALVEGFLSGSDGELMPYTIVDRVGSGYRHTDDESDLEVQDKISYLGKQWTVVEIDAIIGVVIAPSEEVYTYDEYEDQEYQAKELLRRAEEESGLPELTGTVYEVEAGEAEITKLLNNSGIYRYTFDPHDIFEVEEVENDEGGAEQFTFDWPTLKDDLERDGLWEDAAELREDGSDWEHVETIKHGNMSTYQYVEKGTDTETLEHPSQYAKPTDIADFKLDDYSGTQRTILEKYVELNDLVKKEYENVETKTDPRGNEYLGFPIAEDTLERGVRLFSRELSTAQQARVSDLGFYSGVEQAILDKMPEKAKAAQIRGILKPENGVKQEELDWIDIDGFLQQKSDFTKQEVLDYIRANSVAIEEVQLSGRKERDERAPADPNSGDARERLDAARESLVGLFGLGSFYDLASDAGHEDAALDGLARRLADEAELGHELDTAVVDVFGLESTEENLGLEQEDYEELENTYYYIQTAASQIDVAAFDEGPAKGDGDAQYEQKTLVLPGKYSDYREFLLKMPTLDAREPRRLLGGPPREAESDDSLGLDASPGTRYYIYPNGLYIQESRGEISVITGNTEREFQTLAAAESYLAHGFGVQEGYVERGPDFRGTHFTDHANILVHVRTNERIDADGKRVLMIEEIQSDWHQKGREKGYVSKVDADVALTAESIDDRPALANGQSRGFAVKTVDGTFVTNVIAPADTTITAEDAIKEARRRIVEQRRSTALPQMVPDAPFKKSWHELAMKRMLRYAAENGFDKVAWTTGEQQADRYAISQAVNSIEYSTNLSGQKLVEVDLVDDQMIVQFHLYEEDRIAGSHIGLWEGKHLADVVGKELAQQIIENEKGKIEGEGLKIGGSGMAGFYDKMIPSFVNKYTKKWGGKVEETNITTKEPVFGLSHQNQPEDLPVLAEGFRTYAIAEAFAKASDLKDILILKDVNEGGRVRGYKIVKSMSAPQTAQVHSVDVTLEMKQSVARGQKLFAKRTGETAKLLTDVLPQAHTSVILAGIKSTLVGSELEMTPHAMETVRLLDNEIEYRNYRDARLKKGDSIEDIDREFDEQHLGAATAGFTNDTRSFAIMAQVGDEMRIDYARAGYTDEDLAGYDELIRNLHTLAETVDFGIVYVFDDILPEERFHVEDLRAGRTDRQALEELQENGIWKNVGVQFALEYGELSPADKASEIAAKLATKQAAKYGWDTRSDFAEQSKAFLDTWYDGILRRNAVFIEENGIDAFKEKFRRISNAKTTAGNASRNTKNKGNKRTDGRSGGKGKGARPKQQTAKSGSENAPRSDRRKAQKLSLEQERQFAEALGVDPAKVRVKLRRHAQTLRENGRDVNDVPYVPGSDEERIREVKNILHDSLLAADDSGFTQGDYDYALEQFFNPDLEPRTKTVLGIALIDHLGSTGELEMMNSIADRTIVHVGEAAQALQAASIAAKYDFARGVILAKKALERQGKQLTQEHIDEIKKLTQQYAKSQRDKALLAQMLSDAEDVIAEQQAELDEAQRALSEALDDIGATAGERAEMAAALEEALEENEEKDGFIENLKRQLARWKAKAMSDGTTAVKLSATHKQLLSEMPMIKAELAKMFPGKALKSAEGGKLRSVESSEQFDDEHRTMLVKYIANRIFEGDGYQETIDHISNLTNGVLNTDEIRALHNDAETFTEGSPVEKSAEAIAKQKKRNEHKQAAKQFRKEAGIDAESSKAGRKASRVAGAKELNSLDKEILKLADGNEMLGAGAIFYNKALNINDWYDMIARGYPDLTPSQQNDLFVKARKLRDQARENRMRFVAEQKGIIKDTKADFEEYKKRMYIADSVIKKHKGTLDAMYRKHQKNLAQQTVVVAEQIAGVPKGLSATGEISMFLRQNGLLLLTHPIRTLPQAEALLRGLLSGAAGSKSGALTKNTFLGNFTDDAGMWSETQLLAYMEKLRNNKYFDDAQAHGVEFTNIGDFNIADEHFVANVFIAMADARKVWLLNDKADNETLDAATNMLEMPLRIFGRSYKAIEIANTLFGDAARLAAYGYYAEHIADSLDAFESRKARRYAARAVNAFGGRGDIKSALGAGGVISKLANISLFSARLLVSRPQSLFYLTTGFALAPKGMRLQMALDGAKFYGFITLLALLAGMRLNWWDKDFGKMKYGPRDLNIDILAGMDAPLQWLFGVAVGTTQQIGAMSRGESSDAIEENFERLFNKYWFNVDMAKKSGNWLEGLRYWRGKSSPTVSFGFDYFTGKDFIGRPFNWKNAATSRLIPLSYTQTYNALYYDRFASVMKEPSAATGERDLINGLITLGATAVGVGISQYPNEDNSHAETLAWEMWEPFPGRELTPEEKTAAIEQKRITTGLRNLYRMRTKAEAEGKPTAAIDAAIKMYSEKYSVDAKTTEKLKTQGTAGDFDFVTEKFTLKQVDKLLEVATLKERLELRSIRAAKLAGAEKKAKIEQEPPKPLAVRLNNADVEGAAKLYNENQAAFTSEQRFEARRKLLRKVLNSHQNNQLTREGYDAAKAILGDEIRFQYIERPRRERVVRGLDSLKGLP